MPSADHMLLMMRDLGITTQNMFALPEYINGFSNTSVPNETVPLWGSVIDMGGETNLKRPQYLWAAVSQLGHPSDDAGHNGIGSQPDMDPAAEHQRLHPTGQRTLPSVLRLYQRYAE